MLLTNGKIIIIDNNNLDELETLMNTITARARELNGNNKIKFSFADQPFPHYACNVELSYDQLKEAADGVSELNFRAIGDDVITLHGIKNKEIKHIFNLEEHHEIGTAMSNAQLEFENLESEKKNIMADFKAKMEQIETNISQKATLYRQGYEYRQEKVLVQLDFQNKVKLFVDANSQVLLHTEDLTTDDYQMKMEWVDNSFAPAEVPAGTKKSTSTEEEVDMELEEQE
jgi:hypothetical protein